MSDQTMPNTDDRVNIISRVFDAPRELVWKAWTEPEHLMQWWGPEHFTSPKCTIDFRVGGRYHFCMRGPDGKDYWTTGEYLEIVEFERIVFSDFFSDEHANILSPAEYGMGGDWAETLLVTLTFEERDGKTYFTLRHEGCPQGEMSGMMVMGWNQSFDKMVAHLETLTQK